MSSSAMRSTTTNATAATTDPELIAAVLAALQTQGDFALGAQTAAEYSEKFGGLLGEMLEALASNQLRSMWILLEP